MACVVANAQLGVAQTLELFYPVVCVCVCVCVCAIIDDDVHLVQISLCVWCVIQKGTTIKDGCVIVCVCVIGSNSQIGENCILHANVTIYNNIKVGDRVVIHSGCVIGV